MNFKWNIRSNKPAPSIQTAEEYRPLTSESIDDVTDANLEKHHFVQKKRKDYYAILMFLATAVAFMALGFAIGLHVEFLKLNNGRNGGHGGECCLFPCRCLQDGSSLAIS